MSQLTDRYVAATLRTIPDQQRSDIETELRASIEDAVEAGIAAGRTPDQAEREVLTELGDPDRLAAGYAGRPAYLIGPEYFYLYKRLLSVLLLTVVPIVVVVVAVIQAISGASVAEVFGSTVGLIINLVVHIVFWTTLAFYFLERSGDHSVGDEWSLDQLPSASAGGRIEMGDSIASIVVLVFTIVGILVFRTTSPLTGSDGEPISLFDPAAWDFWIPFLIVVLVLEVLFEVIKLRVGRWTWTLASVNLALNAAFAIPTIYLLISGGLLNPEFFAALGWDSFDVGSTTQVITAGFIAAVCIWDSVDGFRNAAR